MKTNKGFSMVELIIVIAIMAILAGALAPALIKYINKSRISTDIQTGNTIATAIQTALSNEGAYDAASVYDYGSGATSWVDLNAIYDTATDSFMTAVKDTVGAKAPKVKSKKCVGKGTNNTTGGPFEFALNRTSNVVYVRIGGSHLVFPSADSCLTDDTTTHSGTAN